VTADDAYLRRALAAPDADIVQGYPKGVMTAVMENQPKLSSSQIDQMVAYLETIH